MVKKQQHIQSQADRDSIIEMTIKTLEAKGLRYIRTREDGDKFIIFGANKKKYTYYAISGVILIPHEQKGLMALVEIAER